jgi:hypothetical protein
MIKAIKALGNEMIKGSVEQNTCAILELHTSEIAAAQYVQNPDTSICCRGLTLHTELLGKNLKTCRSETS